MRGRLIAGATAGVAAASTIARTRKQHSLAGEWQLGSVWRSESANETCSAPRTISGLLVYEPTGRMWTQCYEIQANGVGAYTGYTGRWWLHDAIVGQPPPHGDQPLVEHHVRSSSDPDLVDKTVYQQYSLSEDGGRLTLTDVQILLGSVSVMEQSEWHRRSQSV